MIRYDNKKVNRKTGEIYLPAQLDQLFSEDDEP